MTVLRRLDAVLEPTKQAVLSICNRRQIYRYRDFYRAYPGIVGTLSPQFAGLLLPEVGAGQEGGTRSPLSDLPVERLVNSLSYSHFELLVEVADPLKRAFYEIECIRSNWSVRELKRQVVSLYFERSGLSQDKEKLAALARQHEDAEDAAPEEDEA